MSNEKQRIPLRALLIHFSDKRCEPAIALPDGRILMHGHTTFSSERVLVHLHPGAVIEWLPDSDATINHVMELP